MKRLRAIVISYCLVFSFSTISVWATDENSIAAGHQIGNGAIGEGWTGSLPGTVSFTVPSGKKGWWHHGLRRDHDGTIDGLDYAGILIELDNSKALPFDLTVKISTPPQPDRLDFVAESSARVSVNGVGRQRLWIPWSAFDFQQAQPAFLKFIQKIEISSSAAAKITKVELAVGATIALQAGIKSHAPASPSTVTYSVKVVNWSDQPQAVALAIERHGWEEMRTAVFPENLELAPKTSGDCTVTVKISDRVPLGGQEKQTLRAIANGTDVARLDFITGRDVAHPYLLHTVTRWQEVRDKVAKYDWAKTGQKDILDRAERWHVPPVPKFDKLPTDGMGFYLYPDSDPANARGAAIAWQLTREHKYAEKVAVFLRQLSDPLTGYPKTLRGTPGSLVQEGGWFKSIAEAYDMILDADVLSMADKKQIEKTFRMYLETIDFECAQGNISNWNVSELAGAIDAALCVGDLERAWRFYEGPCGVLDQFGKGIMDDGWWYECSISYNGWMAQLGTEIALAVEPWGKNLRTMRIPNSFAPNYSLVPWAGKQHHLGMNFDKFGPVTRNYVQISDLWDGFLPFVDYRGIMFGANDSDEKLISGNLYELAYYVFREPRYAAMIQRNDKRDLLWAVPELPKQMPELFKQTADAHNAGMSVLRSQTPGREQREQIQAVLKYGTHGGFHGHFDRGNLLSLMRYGRSFFNPVMVAYGYGSFTYKFYNQNSIINNMVVVDRKMQEPVEAKQLLFHTGPMLQAAAIEVNARWSYPPFGGIPWETYSNVADKVYDEGHSIPVPTNAPKWGAVTGYTEPVKQRRLLAVTDDYVIVADYLKSKHEHTFDCLYQTKGFQGFDGDVKPLRHDAQWDSDPLNCADLVTDCNWFQASGPVVGKQEMLFTKLGMNGSRGEIDAQRDGSGTSRNEAGVLKLAYHNVWPPQRELMVGQAPENVPGISKKVKWRVRSGDKILAEGHVGTWAVGAAEIDLPVNFQTPLEIEVQLDQSERSRKTLFLANAHFVTAENKEIPIPASAVTSQNTETAPAGKDYEGGDIVIAGQPYSMAVAAEPKDIKQPAVLSIRPAGQDVTRFKATLGGDFPPGPRMDRLKTIAISTRGTEARFLTVIEPYETTPMVKSVLAVNADMLRVELADGRVQEIKISNLDADNNSLSVQINETKHGRKIRTEIADANAAKP